MSRLVGWFRKLFEFFWAVIRNLLGIGDSQSKTAINDHLRSLPWPLDERVGHEGISVNVIILTPVRLFGEGLAACLSSRPEMCAVVLNDLATLRVRMAESETQVILIDVTQGIELFDVRGIAGEWPDVAIVALGLNEQRQDVIACGRTGFAGYVSRDASIDALHKALCEIANGRLACPPEISSGLLRALFHRDPTPQQSDLDIGLTPRESEVLELLGRGLSNKEIGSKLFLSVATVKHHVHHVLEKLKLQRRAQAMRRVQDAPWITRRSVMGGKR